MIDTVKLPVDFIALAKAARADLEATGKGYAGEEVHAYIRARITGEDPDRPRSVLVIYGEY